MAHQIPPYGTTNINKPKHDQHDSGTRLNFTTNKLIIIFKIKG